MSVLSMFANQPSGDISSLRYDPSKHKPVNFSSQASLYQTRNQIPVGNVQVVINTSNQLLVYQNQQSPIISTAINSDFTFCVRNEIYIYIGDDVIAFSTPTISAKFVCTIGCIISNADGGSLQYFDVEQGGGKDASTGDSVTVSYYGFVPMEFPVLGDLFDSNSSFSFEIGSERIIKGWSQGCTGMKPSSARVIVIPSSLAYGKRSIGKIPSNSPLVFLIRVNSIEKSGQKLKEKLMRQGAVALPGTVKQETPDEKDTSEFESENPSEISMTGFVEESEVMDKIDALTKMISDKLMELDYIKTEEDPDEAMLNLKCLIDQIEDQKKRIEEQEKIIRLSNEAEERSLREHEELVNNKGKLKSEFTRKALNEVKIRLEDDREYTQDEILDLLEEAFNDIEIE